MTLGAGDTVLCSGTLRRDVAFRERVAAAAAGGFSGLSLWGRDHQVARAEGLSDQDIALLLADHGLSVAELDPAWWWWLPGASEVHIPPELDGEQIFAFGGTWSLDEAVAAVAGLCDRAAEHGLLVHLEFLPWSRIPDLATAWQVVRDADRPNGGLMLDAWHYFRSDPDGALLRSVPGASILGVQLSDAPAATEPDPVHATLHERLLPGAGELDPLTLLADLRESGAAAPLGVEVFSDALHARDPEEVGRAAGAALPRLLGPGRNE